MFLVYWNAGEVSEYKDANDFLEYYEAGDTFSTVCMATAINFTTKEIMHYTPDELAEWINEEEEGDEGYCAPARY